MEWRCYCSPLLFRCIRLLLISLTIVFMMTTYFLNRTSNGTIIEVRTNFSELASLPAACEGCRQNLNSTTQLPTLFKEVFPVASAFNIFLVETSNATHFPPRMICSIESFCRANSDAVVWLFLTTEYLKFDERLQTVLDTYVNLRLVHIEVDLVLQETPLLDLYRSGKVNVGFTVANLSNLLRMALLYRLGGVYADTDIIALRGMAEIKNTLGWQDKDFQLVNGAVAIFDRGHPFLMELMMEVAGTFDGSMWGHNMPNAITRTLKKLKCHIGETSKGVYINEEEDILRPCNFSVVSLKSFYPFYVSELAQLISNNVVVTIQIGQRRFEGRRFLRQKDDGRNAEEETTKDQILKGKPNQKSEETLRLMEEVFPESYTFHLYNKLTGKHPVALGSLMDRAATLVCPVTRRLGRL